MIVYRLCRAAHVTMDGEGARIYGGRWNSPGRPVVYSSGSLALASLEYLVHIDSSEVPSDLVAIFVEIPDEIAVESVDRRSLPVDWSATVGVGVCQEVGDRWLASGASAVLRVPSAPIPEEFNFLLNPRHEDSGRVRVVSRRGFVFDPRVLG